MKTIAPKMPAMQAIRRMPRACRRPRVRGFTLLELMIVVVVIALLAAIAYPSYRAYIIRAHRTEATHALLEASAKMEQFFSQYQHYGNTTNPALIGGCNATPTPLVCPTTTVNGYYRLSFGNGTGAGVATNTSATSYSIQAAPLGTQNEADKKCGTFIYNDRSQRSNANNPGGGTVQECWGRN